MPAPTNLKELRHLLQRERKLSSEVRRLENLADADLKFAQRLKDAEGQLYHMRKQSGLSLHCEEIDWTTLPTFGGEAPADTEGVWSWDETHILVGSTCEIGGLRIAER